MEALTPIEIGSNKMFGGYNKRFRHFSPTLGCSMTFSLFFPPSPSPSSLSSSHSFPVLNQLIHPSIYPSIHEFISPAVLQIASAVGLSRDPCQRGPRDDPTDAVLYWLSGLTCTDENFVIKSGAQRMAAARGITLVAPDTSPRGLNVEGEADSWDFGVGAGFYLNATNEKWKNWRMYDYVVKELPALLSENFEQLDTSRASIFGHSMGGHGALVIYLKNLDKYKSVSAFAPIVNPINCPWGQKAFSNYLGTNKSDWEEYDATCLVSKFNKVSAPILIDQGEDDNFLKNQLLPHKFEEACKSASVPVTLRMQPGYDHSYFFIASFIDDHIAHHANALV